jgi:SecD/SecF fusion protein
MLVYIRIRFRQWRFGGAALLGVLHDVLIVISFYAIFQVTVNNPFIAGILTVVGYSINDTIVIFDRIRENLKYMKRGTLVETIDTSLTQTLGRSLMTSATTLIVMVPLLVLAGDAIRVFILPLMVGVLAGTYSSICMCSPLYYEFSTMSKVSTYERQVKLAKKQAKKEAKEAKKLGTTVKTPASDEPAPSEDTSKAAESKVDAKPAEKADTTAASTETPSATEEKKSAEEPVKGEPKKKLDNGGERRSKRYVKGNKKKTTEIRDDEEGTFRL